jgi:type I restriction enzyme, S subunit
MSSAQVPEGYKQTEVGVIPEDWETLLLGDIITLQRGFDLPNRLRKPGIVPIVSSSGITDTHNQSPVSSPGVVTGRYGTIGEVFFINQDFWPLNTTLFVSNFKDNDPLFIYFLLKTIDYKTHSGKSGVPGVNRNDLHEISVKLPPLPEQQTIAQALSDVDALIASLDKLIAKQRHLKTAAMQQLLTGKMRSFGFGEGKGYKQTEVGLIPEDWDIKKLGDVLKIRHGRSQHEIVDPNGIYPILATGGEIGRTNTPLYSEPSVLIGRKGTIDTPKYMDTPFWTVDTLFYSEISKYADSKFVFYKFNLIDWYSYNEASGVPSLNAATIERIDQAFPTSKEEQRAIATVLSDMDTAISALETRRAKTQAIKQGMMQELLTGRTRLV